MQVDVRILVHRERTPTLTHERERLLVVVEYVDRPLEQTLDVERARFRLAPLVLAEDTMCEVGGNGWLVMAEPCKVGLRGQPTVFRPLALPREVTRGTKILRRGGGDVHLPQPRRPRRPELAGSAPAPRPTAAT